MGENAISSVLGSVDNLENEAYSKEGILNQKCSLTRTRAKCFS